MLSNDLMQSLGMVLVTFICSVISVHMMKRVAHHIGAIDIPRSDEGNRHIHKRPIPKLGAVGIFFAFLFGYMIYGVHSIKMNAILISSFIIILTGIIDDISDLKARYQLVAQLVAACIIVFYGGIYLTDITIFSLAINFGIFKEIISILFIIACINIINLTDGLDGLSGGVTSIFYFSTAIICFYQGRLGSMEMTLTLLMLGSTLGFLVHNFYPAKLFDGQCSMFMGFMISIICLLGFKGTALTSLFIPIAILGLPILDTLFAIIRRMLKKQPIFQADKAHIHHQLLGMNFSHRNTVLIIYFINILFALTSIFYTLGDSTIALMILGVLIVLLMWFVLYTNIITDKKLKIVEKMKKRNN